MKKKEEKVVERKNSSSETKRRFTPYELNLIFKAEFDLEEVAQNIELYQPVEYYLELAEFRHQLFKVNSHTLIPRVETEEIIEIALNILAEKFAEKKFIFFSDIGTGSGCIGISFALELIKRQIHFHGFLSDYSKDAIKVALKNAQDILNSNAKIYEGDSEFVVSRNKFETNILRVTQEDLRTNKPFEKVDFMFANLPYIPSARIPNLDTSVKNYEPISALDGGNDGLDLIRILITKSSNAIKKGGVLILEVDDTHTSIPDEFLKDFRSQIIKDSFDRNRFWVLEKL